MPDGPPVVELTADDIRRIDNLLADYLLAVDHRDIVLFRSLWADDAIVHVNRDPVGLGSPLVGREAIVAAFERYFARMAVDEPGRFTRHLCTTRRLDVVDGDVVAISLMLAVRQELHDGAIAIAPRRTGLYRDRFVRAPDGWRFAERRIEFDPPEQDGVELPPELYGLVPASGPPERQ